MATASTTSPTRDVTLAESSRITIAASTWKGTPYKYIGASSAKGTGGDCSGTTNGIFAAAGFPYTYKSTAEFAHYAVSSGLFRELSSTETKQNGDVLLWPDHMAIYSTFTTEAEKPDKTTPRVNNQGQKWTQFNDMWTASRPNGPDYRAAALKFFGKMSAPRVFRRVVPK